MKTFNLGHTLGSGQVFRWGRDADGWWKGLAYGTVIHLRQTGEHLHFRASGEDVCTRAGTMPITDFLRWYLRLNQALEIRTRKGDRFLRKARNLLAGLRIVRQEPYECIISYILSVQAHMNLTRQRIAFLAKTLGRCLVFEGACYYTFPDPGALAGLDGSFFRRNGFGWRSERVAKSAGILAEELAGKDLALEGWRELVDRLREISGTGVGVKVARCIELFSLDRLNAVPVDTWVRKYARDWYGITGSDESLCAWAEARWGPCAGYCNELLFAYYRELHGKSVGDRVIAFEASDARSAVMPYEA